MSFCFFLRRLTGFFILTLVLVAGFSGFRVFAAPAEEARPQEIPVFVSIQPQKYFVERIGGDRVNVAVLLPPGKSPATFSPTPVEMVRLARSDLFFRIGVPFETSLMPKIENVGSSLRIVDTRQGIRLRRMAGGDACETHGHDHATGDDPHIWLNPLLVIRQAETITRALCDIDPDHCPGYQANYRIFKEDLEDLHQRLSTALAPVRGETFFVFHPAFGYFADAYGLKQTAVEVEGKAPRARKLADLIDKAVKSGVRVIFVQPQFDDRAARNIADAINGVVVSLNPLAEDYIRNLETIAEKVRQGVMDRSFRNKDHDHDRQ